MSASDLVGMAQGIGLSLHQKRQLLAHAGSEWQVEINAMVPGPWPP